MIVMSRHLRTWNIPECRQEGAVCPPREMVSAPGTDYLAARSLSNLHPIEQVFDFCRMGYIFGLGTYTEGLNR